MSTQTLNQNTQLQSANEQSAAFGATIRRSALGSFAPLLASLEELGKEFPGSDGPAQRLGHVVEMLESTRHGVEALVDLIAPEEQQPSNCTLEELARCALRGVPVALRGDIQLALEDAHTTSCVDGARFSRCFSYLLLASLPSGREAMLHVRREQDDAAFSLLVPAFETPNRSGAPDRDEFMQLVAERELVRLGGSFECHRWGNGALQFTARLPLAPTSGDTN